MTAGYGIDLAYIHDSGFGSFARGAAPVLLDALKRTGLERGLVIDVGCGSGILAKKVRDAGYDVLGIDISRAMIALAWELVPDGQFCQESMLSAKLSSCVAIAAVGECINYTFDRGNTKQGLGKLFRRFHQALLPGGVLLLDMAEPGRVPGNGLRRTCSEGKDWALLYSAKEDAEHQFLTRRITSFRKVGEFYRRKEEVHRLRLFERSQVAAQLRDVGFHVRFLRGYGPLTFPPGYVGFLARKP
jgi:SAM-dependent methyltransferase